MGLVAAAPEDKGEEARFYVRNHFGDSNKMAVSINRMIYRQAHLFHVEHFDRA